MKAHYMMLMMNLSALVSRGVLLIGGGGKALTMTMTPWNFLHGQWSKRLFSAQISWTNQRLTILFFALISCQNLRLTISTMKNLDFGHGHGRNFDHLTIVISKFRPWSWSKIVDHMTMTPTRRPYGQKIMVALPPPQIFLECGLLPLIHQSG